MKITIPPDVSADIETGLSSTPTTHVDISMRDFVVRVILRDRQWGAEVETLYTGMELRGLFNTAKAGDVVELTSAQYDKLLAVAKKPTEPYNPAVAFECKPFFDAITKPTEK